jgi:hypothetical protein
MIGYLLPGFHRHLPVTHYTMGRHPMEAKANK